MSEYSAADIPPRDVLILKLRVDNPTASTRELSRILETEYDVSLSHNRINEILREMADSGVFRETVVPDEDIFRFCLFRFEFNYPNFADQWEECYWDLVDDPHVFMFFNADSRYHWQLVMQFRSIDQMGRWIHEFFKYHGDLISGFHNTMLHRVHKFQTDAAVFDDILRETEEGREYLENNTDGSTRHVEND